MKIIYIILLFNLVINALSCKRQQELEIKTMTKVTYPEDYRNWTRVKSMVIQEGHEYFKAFGGFHHVYANDIALGALRKNDSFPPGAVMVFELYQEISEDYAITEGARLVIGVMEKDPNRFTETNGWGFEDFKFTEDGYQRMVTDAKTQCLSCHKSQATTDFVYSKYRK